MNNQVKKYTLEFEEEELIIMHNVFEQLTSQGLHEWMELVKEGKQRTDESFQQWLITSRFNDIREKTESKLKKVDRS